MSCGPESPHLLYSTFVGLSYRPPPPPHPCYSTTLTGMEEKMALFCFLRYLLFDSSSAKNSGATLESPADFGIAGGIIQDIIVNEIAFGVAFGSNRRVR